MMYIFKNILNFAKYETIIFIILIICILTSSFVMNFSFGLYFNYNTAINENNEELKTIMPFISENEKLTKGEFQKFIEALDEQTQDKINLIYASSDLTKIGYSDAYSFFPMRFDINQGKYGVPNNVKKAWEDTKLIKKGEYISNEDEEVGAHSAMVSQDICDKSIGDSIEFLGQTYTIVGIYRAGSFTPLVPFLTVPADIEISECSFSFNEVLTRPTYNKLISTAKEIIPNKLNFPELQLPDDDIISMYRNIILISIIIAIVSVMNFAMLYLFVIRKRKNELAIMRLCGARRIHVAGLYLCECIFISVPIFLLGSFAFDIMLNNVFKTIFPYMNEIYSLSAYALIFLIYTVVMLIVLGIVVIMNVHFNVKDCLSEGKI